MVGGLAVGGVSPPSRCRRPPSVEALGGMRCPCAASWASGSTCRFVVGFTYRETVGAIDSSPFSYQGPLALPGGPVDDRRVVAGERCRERQRRASGGQHLGEPLDRGERTSLPTRRSTRGGLDGFYPTLKL